MPWVKLDEHIDDHPKFAEVGTQGLALFMILLCYCNRQHNDGFVPQSVLTMTLRKWAISADVVDAMLAVRLLEPADRGVRMHDYLEYQPSRNEVEEKRTAISEARSQAGIKGNTTRWQTDRKAIANRSQTDRKAIANRSQTDRSGSGSGSGSGSDSDNVKDSSSPQTARRRREHIIDEPFHIFWTAYPRKVGKATALRAWSKLRPSPSLAETLTAALHLQAATWDDPQFIPHPSTWLNGRRWEDEIVKSAAQLQRERDEAKIMECSTPEFEEEEFADES